tara:strand:+ start:264 stop:863 length:600 start_codon:yes stop_codon:yes gene_type:complete
MKIKNGDLLKVNLENDEMGYAEKVGNNSDEYEVYFLTKEDDDTWTYEDTYSLIPKESVIKHVKNFNDYNEAWTKLGFKMQRDSSDKCTFRQDLIEEDAMSVTSIDHSSSDESQKLGSEFSYDDESIDEEDESYESSFIDDSEIGCENTNQCSCETCESIRKNNIEYINWIPDDIVGHAVKQVIDRIEWRVKQTMDNENF